MALSNRAATLTKVLKTNLILRNLTHLQQDQAEMQADYFVLSLLEKVSCKLRGLLVIDLLRTKFSTDVCTHSSTKFSKNSKATSPHPGAE